ncbi:MAG: NAD(P)-binding domain-containing protein [Saprospiraceae bacterium]|nr:NAD(P)-binding domain-containing protein [Saprospiraceae bacterium]
MILEEILIYGITLLICAAVVYFYLRAIKKKSQATEVKVNIAKEEGRFEPLSLHPHIDLSTCIGSGACIAACPEKDILGLVNNKATVINATSCVGHGACFHACPVEAITLRIGTETRGVELPHVNQTYETNIKGIYIAGELGGMGLIKNSVEQGKQAMDNINKSITNKKDDIYDVVIIGAGPAGISATLTAKKHNLNFLTLEQDTLGGTVYSFPRAKIVMTNPMDLPLYGKVKLFDTSKDELLNIWNDALSKNNVTIQEKTKVESITPLEDGTFKIKTNKESTYDTQCVLIAIGRRGSPRKLNVPGEGLPKVAYRLIESERITDKNILVVGGGDSAIESAMLLMDQNNVTLSYRKGSFSRIKSKNEVKIKDAILNKKLNVVFNSNLSEIFEDHIHLKLEDGEIDKIENDLVYIFAGGELPTKFLQGAGIEIKKRFGYIMKKHN